MAKRGNPAWVKGVSGNPSGRPKAWPEGRKRALTHSEEAFDVLVDLLRDGSVNPAVRRQCAMDLISYAHGRPVQHSTSEDLTKIPSEELNAKVREIVLDDERKAG